MVLHLFNNNIQAYIDLEYLAKFSGFRCFYRTTRLPRNYAVF